MKLLSPKWARRAEIVCLLTGLVCIGLYLGSRLEAALVQHYEGYRLAAAEAGEQPSWPGYIKALFSPSRTERELDELKSRPAPKTNFAFKDPEGLIGRIVIKRLQLSAIVKEGLDARTLRRAVGHVPGTALPGEAGNVALAGHRDTFFRPLRDVRVGDRVELETPRATFTYQVESIRIVRPSDVEVLDPTPYPALTLITCYPFNYVGKAPKRFIVRARQLDAAAAD